MSFGDIALSYIYVDAETLHVGVAEQALQTEDIAVITQETDRCCVSERVRRTPNAGNPGPLAVLLYQTLDAVLF